MKALSNFLRYQIRGEFIIVGLIAAGIGAAGFIGLKLFGGSKKKEGKLEATVEQYEIKKGEELQITKDKNEYLKMQVPKRRRYEEAIKKEDNAKERAEATFDLFDRSRK